MIKSSLRDQFIPKVVSAQSVVKKTSWNLPVPVRVRITVLIQGVIMKFLRPAVLVLMLTSAQTVHANPAEQSLPRSMELVAVMLAQSQICTQGHQHTQLKLNEKIEYASKNTRLPARVVRKEASERAKYISDMITSRGLQNRFCNASMASLD